MCLQPTDEHGLQTVHDQDIQKIIGNKNKNKNKIKNNTDEHTDFHTLNTK